MCSLKSIDRYVSHASIKLFNSKWNLGINQRILLFPSGPGGSIKKCFIVVWKKNFCTHIEHILDSWREK